MRFSAPQTPQKENKRLTNRIVYLRIFCYSMISYFDKYLILSLFSEIGVFVKKYAWGNMAAWKPKSAGACTGIPTWSKSFASTLRGKQEENMEPKDSIADLEKLSFPVLYNQRYRQPPCQVIYNIIFIQYKISTRWRHLTTIFC